MPLTIYNTLTRQKETFRPVDPAGRRVNIYNCGPTVYDRFHIGNARNFVVMDIVRRYLEWLGYDVFFVQNLTDIDDKIIARANEEDVPAEEIARRFTDAYFEDAGKLGVRKADRHPKATEYVEAMIRFMQDLEAKKLAYPSGGSLYFRVRRFADYGKLARRNVDELREGTRIETEAGKEDPLDFALWKAAKPGEPKWPSPWGEGRPGWHTECAVMVHEIFGGETIDIHAGGHDLIFPHHENEIAQCESLTGHGFARYWLHNGFLNIDSEKMSKSLGNFLRIDQALERFRPDAVRWFLLSAHYRHPLDFTEEALQMATAALDRIHDGLRTGEDLLRLAGREPASGDLKEKPLLKPLIERFESAMNDDFNTPRAMAGLHEIVGAIHEERQKANPDNEALALLVGLGMKLRKFFGLEVIHDLTGAAERSGMEARGELGDASAKNSIHAAIRDVHERARELGKEEIAELLDAGLSQQDVDASTMIELLIEARSRARKQKAFELADAIRDRLAEAGIAIEDHPQGTLWKPIEPSKARP